MLPGLLNDRTGEAALVFYRLCALALAGLFALSLAGGTAGGLGEDEEDCVADEDGSLLLERVEAELAARRGVPVAVVLADPDGIEDSESLLARVRLRIADPVLLGGRPVFGLVLSGDDEGAVESAAWRVLATAGSLGAEETRAGARPPPETLSARFRRGV